MTIDGGKRQGVAKAYLKDIKNTNNLQIENNTDVLKIIFENKKAIGVEIKVKKLISISATRKLFYRLVLLTLQKILQLSGVGTQQL